jgi:TrpR-related protein YerC/YecD
MSTQYPDKDMQNLIQAITSLRTDAELAALRDLMTVKELKDISQRWQIVLLLNQNVPYLDIAKQVGVSTTTVTRCALWLHHGQGGYKTALSRLKL